MTLPRSAESKVVPFELLNQLARTLHRDNKKIITTNGCFDLLHWGHIKYLSQARALGDVLLCGVNSDRSVKALKGSLRPVCAERERALQLAALESVDYVVIFDENTPERFLEIVRPFVHTKGGDYDIKKLPEAEVVKRAGGRIELLPFTEGFSSTLLMEKIRNAYRKTETPTD